MGRKVGSKTTKPNPGNPGRRFTLTERERLKNEAQDMDLRGYSGRQIAQKLNISGATAHNLLAEIQKDYQEAYVDNRKAMVMRATAAHLDIIREAQEHIARLKERGKIKSFSKSGVGHLGDWSEDGEFKEDAEIGGYLSIITENWRQIALLHGLHELPKQVFNVQVNNNTVNVFDQVLKAVLGAQDEGASLPINNQGRSIENGPVLSASNDSNTTRTDKLSESPFIAPPIEVLQHEDSTNRQEETAGQG